MLRNILKYLIPLLLAVLVFAAASHMDRGEVRVEEAVLQETAAPTETTIPETTVPETTVPETTEPQPERFLLTFVGDCTLGSSPGLRYVPTSFVNTIGEDYDYPFRNVKTYFESDDFTFINLEGTFCEDLAAADKTFTFKGPPEYVQMLTGSSVEGVTLANNHSYDYGIGGYNSTKAILKENNILYAEQNGSALVTTESGLTVGIYAASFSINFDDLKQEVASLREQGAEVIVFAIHWGAEGSYKPQSHQVQQAYDAIDAGVDIVWGSHPHVLQRIEAYNGGIIYYSLGNFAFGGNHFPPDMDTAVLQQEIIRQPDGSVSLGELTIIPCSLSSIPEQNNFQPTPYAEGSEEYDRTVSKLDGSWTGRDLNVGY